MWSPARRQWDALAADMQLNIGHVISYHRVLLVWGYHAAQVMLYASVLQHFVLYFFSMCMYSNGTCPVGRTTSVPEIFTEEERPWYPTGRCSLGRRGEGDESGIECLIEKGRSENIGDFNTTDYSLHQEMT